MWNFITRLFGFRLAVDAFVLSGAIVLSGTAAAQSSDHQAVGPAAFLLQMRCQTPGTLPGDPNCGSLSAVREGEDPGYRLNNGENGPGRIDSINIPITRHGKWRVVSPDAHVASTDPARQGGVSIEGIGARYLSVLGSWSPVALSRFANPECERMPESSDRFLDAWVLGPAHDTGAPQGAGLTRSNNLAGAHGAACPDRYHAAAFTWEKRPFTYSSGRRFESLVSVHYSAASPPGIPGPAEQRERLYLAHGIGLARWEKWSRDDWSDRRSGQGALEQARAVFASHRCNRPIEDVDQQDGVRYGSVTSDGVFAETIVSAPGEASHVWYLTKCEDYAHLMSGSTADLIRRAENADDLFWR
jgi:hypothetical protein